MNRLAHLLLDGKVVDKDTLGGGAPAHEGGRGRPRALDGRSRAHVRQRHRRSGRSRQGRDVVQAGRRSRQRQRHGRRSAALYQQGKGVEADLAKAVTLYKRAVDLGNAVCHDGPRPAPRAGQGRREERGGRGRALPQGGEPRKLDRHEQPRLDAAGRPGRGAQGPRGGGRSHAQGARPPQRVLAQADDAELPRLDQGIPPGLADASCATPASIPVASTASSASPRSPPSTPTSTAPAETPTQPRSPETVKRRLWSYRRAWRQRLQRHRPARAYSGKSPGPQ